MEAVRRGGGPRTRRMRRAVWSLKRMRARRVAGRERRWARRVVWRSRAGVREAGCGEDDAGLAIAAREGKGNGSAVLLQAEEEAGEEKGGVVG